MPANDNAIQQIKDRLDIVEVVSSYIKLDKAGANFRACCPFHSEKKPSFFVSPARQIFKCFGCGAGGGIFDFVMKIEGLEFRDALRLLAQRAGVELKSFSPELKTQRERLSEICELATRFFEAYLNRSASGKLVQEYFFERGLNSETIKKWRLGYSPDAWRALFDFLGGRGFKKEEIIGAGLAIASEKNQTPYDRFRNRIIFPVFDLNSQVIGFGGRIFDRVAAKTQTQDKNTAKYINISNSLLYDKSRVLYGLNFGKVALRQKESCILTEGYMDVLLSHQAGFENTVATSGTSLTPFQLTIIKRYTNNLLTAFDMDLAGNLATNRGIELAQNQDFNVKVISMPREKDPADIVLESAEKWQQLVSSAKDIIEFYFDFAFSKSDKETAEGKRDIAKNLLPLLQRIPNKIVFSHWLQKLAVELKVSEEMLLEEIKRMPVSVPAAERIVSSSQGSVAVSAAAGTGLVKDKTRQQLLEERVVALLLYDVKHFSLLEKEHLKLFSPLTQSLLAWLLQKFPFASQDLPVLLREVEKQNDGLSDFISNVEFIFELEKEQTEKPGFYLPDSNGFEEEFELCLEHLEHLAQKCRLEDLTREIQQAEQTRDDEKLKELMLEFNQLSKNGCLR